MESTFDVTLQAEGGPQGARVNLDTMQVTGVPCGTHLFDLRRALGSCVRANDGRAYLLVRGEFEDDWVEVDSQGALTVMQAEMLRANGRR